MRFSRAVVVSIFAACIIVDTPAAARASSATFADFRVTIDGTPGGTVSIRKADSFVAVAAIARAVGWIVVKNERGWSIAGEGRHLQFVRGSRVLSDGNAAVLTLSHASAEISGRLYLASDDIGRLFDIRLAVLPQIVAVTTIGVTSNATFAERARPPSKPTPSPTRSPRRVASVVTGNRLALTLLQSGGDRSYHVALTSAGAAHGVIETTRSNLGATYVGTMTFGTANSALTLGAFQDPAAGTLFHDRTPVGVLAHTGALDIFAGKRAEDSGGVIGIAHRSGSTTKTIELLRSSDGSERIVAGVASTHVVRSWNERREIVVGSRGAGMSESFRSTGRFFGEAAMLGKIGMFDVDDVPLSVNAGYDTSKSTTARAGIRGGGRSPFAPFAGLFTHGAHLGGGMSLSRGTASVSSSYVDASHVVQFALSGASGVRALTMRSSLITQRDFTLELNATAEGSNGLAQFTVRRPHGVIDVVTGYGIERSDRTLKSGPIVGFAAPIYGGLSLETKIEPHGGRESVRIDIVARLAARRHERRLPTVPLSLRVSSPALPARLLVDGLQFATLASVDSLIQMPGGVHTISVESMDGKLASVPTPTLGAMQEANLALWPVREVFGTILVDAPAAVVPRHLTMTGMQVVLLPGGSIAYADAAGRFSFGPQPVVPGSALGLVLDGLPPGLGDGTTVELATNGETTVFLRPTQRIERVRF